MTRKVLSLLIALFVGLAAVASPAEAQTKRPGDTFYLKFGAGFSDYTGDFAGPFEGFSGGDGFPYGWVGELGYQTSPAFAVGLAYQAGRYPLVNNNASGTDPDRLSGQLLGRYTFGAKSWTVSPYVDAGANLSFASRSFDDTGGGPTVGAGLDIVLSGWASFYVESRVNFTLGDDAMDGIDMNTGFDGLSHLGVGLKMNFSSVTTPPRVVSLDGPTSAQVGESVTYTAQVNQEEATRPLTYSWAFGDGASSSGLTANHTYREAGTYTVAFSASNEAGTARETMTIEVSAVPASIAAVDASPNPVDEGNTVQFSSNVEGTAPISYNWSFGDGTSGEGESPTHTYEEPGQYTARLTASNEAGEDTRTVTVRVNQVLPQICTTISEMGAAYFERNSSDLTEEARKSLQENVEILTRCSNLTAEVEGFAAPNERNPQSLSEDRARAVADFYEENGVPESRVESTGQGAVEGVVTKKGGTRQYRRADTIPRQSEGGM
jgi:PKD repeat protein